MGTRVYVGNLSFNADEEALRRLCSEGGRNVVKLNMATDRSWRARGFALVDFASEQDAQAAIAALSGLMHEGRPLTVNEAREQKERRGAHGAGWSRRGGTH